MNIKLISRIVLGFGIAALISSGITLVVVPQGAKIALGTLVGGLVFIAAFVATNRQSMTRSFSGKATTFYAVTVVTGALLIGLLIAGNYVAVQKKTSWDVTQGGIYTLSEDTVKTVSALKDDVKVTAFYGAQDPNFSGAKNILDRYQALSPHLKVEFVDPYSNPQLVKEKDIKENGPRIVISHGRQDQRVNAVSEESITNTILKVLRTSEKTIYFTTGHGEADTEDAQNPEGYGLIAKKMADEGLKTDKINLAAMASSVIPDNAAAVVIAGPQKAFLQPEVDALKAYVDRGGSLMVELEPNHEDPALEKFMDDLGFLFDKSLIVDPVSKILGGGAAIPVVQKYAESPVTDKFNLATLFPTARPVIARGDATPRPTVVALTNPSAWGETDLSNPQAKYDEGEKRGELGIVAILDKSDAAKPMAQHTGAGTRVVAIGDSEFVNNQFSKMGGNSDFYLNLANWIAAQDSRITIRPHERDGSRLMLTENQSQFLNIFSLNALPMLVLAAGLSVWLVRRSK